MGSTDAVRRDSMQRLTLVSVMREPLAVTLRFVAWHLAQGFDAIIIYFDDPDDPAIDLVQATGRVTAVRCTPAFWESVGVPPGERFLRRQIVALTHGYRSVTEGWVAIADADELFAGLGRSLPEILADQPAAVRSLRILPGEAIAVGGPRPPGRAHFRTPFTGGGLAEVYGDAAWFVKRNEGMVGHRQGKSITRANTRLARMRQHFPVRRGWVPLTDAVLGPGDGAVLLHFVSETYRSWRDKLEWRLNSSGFRPRIAERLRQLMRDSADPEDQLRALYDRLFVLDADRYERLRALGGAFDLPDDFAEPVGTYFPGVLTAV
ncbi:MAG: glycosyltransferase family 2 protein [Rhodobacteraceae bacterium]|nr:glycosyltransferase family 2 protein [Paracoccaceae bacterium]